jgi:predicted alpha/beta superfamily hydrolase
MSNQPKVARLRMLAFAAAFALCAFAAPTFAQPDPNQRIGATVADAPSPHYRFDSFVVSSADGRQRWRIRLGIPRQRAPTQGFAALYLLDGNAALMEFDAELLAQLARGRAPVLAFVGYDNDLRIDSAARIRDYTPSAVEDAAGAGPRGGGAEAFARVLVERIQPQVRRRARIDRPHEALWGHSLGGLFVLDLLYTRGDAFAQWFSASPSLWWDGGRELGEPERRFLREPLRRPAQVTILQGGREREARAPAKPGDEARVAAQRAHRRGAGRRRPATGFAIAGQARGDGVLSRVRRTRPRADAARLGARGGARAGGRSGAGLRGRKRRIGRADGTLKRGAGRLVGAHAQA